jgi:hypothetical protein
MRVFLLAVLLGSLSAGCVPRLEATIGSGAEVVARHPESILTHRRIEAVNDKLIETHDPLRWVTSPWATLVEVSPGKHSFLVRCSAWPEYDYNTIEIDVEAGKTYFTELLAKFSVGDGEFSGRRDAAAWFGSGGVRYRSVAGLLAGNGLNSARRFRSPCFFFAGVAERLSLLFISSGPPTDSLPPPTHFSPRRRQGDFRKCRLILSACHRQHS